jgi:hypothetical protein
VLWVVLLAGCNGPPAHSAPPKSPVAAGTTDPSALSTPTPAPTPTLAPEITSPPPAAPAGGQPPVTNLVLSGSVAGQGQTGHSIGVCGRAVAGFSVQLQFDASGQSYVLSIALLSYSGPGSYSIPPERVSVRPSSQGSNAQLMPAVTGKVMVNQSESSGSIDAALAGGTHIEGTWACS